MIDIEIKNKINVNDQYCPQNHKCPMVNMCPEGAITQDGHGLPKINHDLCSDCGDCYALCRAFEKNIFRKM